MEYQLAVPVFAPENHVSHTIGVLAINSQLKKQIELRSSTF